MVILERRKCTLCNFVQASYVRAVFILKHLAKKPVERSNDEDDEGSILEYLQNRRNDLETPRKQTEQILEKLWSNDDRFKKLELDGDLVGCSLSDLIRAICFNRKVRHVFVDEKFMETLSFDKARIMLEIVGGLENLETLSIQFPPRFLNTNRFNGVPRFHPSPPITPTAPAVQTSQTKTSMAPLIQGALLKAPKLRRIQLHNLHLCEPNDDLLLAEALANKRNLKKVHLLDFVVSCHDSMDKISNGSAALEFANIFGNGNPDYLSDFSSSSSAQASKRLQLDIIMDTLADLPNLEEVEIRMKQKQSLPGTYVFSSLCTGIAPLRSLVLWNMTLSTSQLRYVCEALCDNTSIQRLEMWCSDLGVATISNATFHDDGDDSDSPLSHVSYRSLGSTSYDKSHFGVLLADLLERNKTLRTMVISHVGLRHAGTVALAHALKKNTTLHDLALLALSPHDYDEEYSVYNTQATSTDTYSDKNTVDSSNYSTRNLTNNYHPTRNNREIISKAVMHMMKNNKSLQSLRVTYDELTQEGCIAISDSLRHHSFLKKKRNKNTDFHSFDDFRSIVK